MHVFVLRGAAAGLLALVAVVAALVVQQRWAQWNMDRMGHNHRSGWRISINASSNRLQLLCLLVSYWPLARNRAVNTLSIGSVIVKAIIRLVSHIAQRLPSLRRRERERQKS